MMPADPNCLHYSNSPTLTCLTAKKCKMKIPQWLTHPLVDQYLSLLLDHYLPPCAKIAPEQFLFYCAGLLWTAPELLRKPDNVTLSEGELQRADVYSFSIVLFEVLYRSYPFDTDPMTPTGTRM